MVFLIYLTPFLVCSFLVTWFMSVPFSIDSALQNLSIGSLLFSYCICFPFLLSLYCSKLGWKNNIERDWCGAGHKGNLWDLAFFFFFCVSYPWHSLQLAIWHCQLSGLVYISWTCIGTSCYWWGKFCGQHQLCLCEYQPCCWYEAGCCSHKE